MTGDCHLNRGTSVSMNKSASLNYLLGVLWVFYVRLFIFKKVQLLLTVLLSFEEKYRVSNHYRRIV